LAKLQLIPQFVQEKVPVLQLTLALVILDTQETNVNLLLALENQLLIPLFVLGKELAQESILAHVILVTQEINVKQ
jgi:hypothetical protein